MHTCPSPAHCERCVSTHRRRLWLERTRPAIATRTEVEAAPQRQHRIEQARTDARTLTALAGTR